ncbi:MAG: MFS transporter [Chloroflexi bacterium]|nr:MFS transporter [Chloroflexota bacterium]
MREMLGNSRRILVWVIAANILASYGFRIWGTMFTNFAVEEMRFGPATIGLVQSVREIPGLLGFAMSLLAMRMRESRIMVLALAFLGTGFLLASQARALWPLLLGVIIMSFGNHYFYTANSALMLLIVDKRRVAKVLGQVGSVGSFAAILATVTVFLISDLWGYRTIFAGVGLLTIVGTVALLPMSRQIQSDGTRRAPARIVLRRRYGLYYALAFLLGARAHISLTFAILLLVKEHGIAVQTTAALYLLVSVLSIGGFWLEGNIIARFGERLSLSLVFVLVTLIYLGYIFITYLPALLVLFVLDELLFGFEIALTTYFQKIAVTQEEITSNIAVQQTLVHLAAVVVPVIGGAVWELFGRQLPFLVGIVVTLTALALTQALRTPPEAPATATA